MSSRLIPAFLCVCLSSCAVTDAILDVPMSLFDDDGNEVETTVGDALAAIARIRVGRVAPPVGAHLRRSRRLSGLPPVLLTHLHDTAVA